MRIQLGPWKNSVGNSLKEEKAFRIFRKTGRGTWTCSTVGGTRLPGGFNVTNEKRDRKRK